MHFRSIAACAASLLLHAPAPGAAVRGVARRREVSSSAGRSPVDEHTFERPALSATAGFAADMALAAAAAAKTYCTVDEDCAGYKGCTFPEDAGECECKGTCRKKQVDCKTDVGATDTWGCRDGKVCFRSAVPHRWSTCVEPIEDFLGLPFLSAHEINSAFDKTEGAFLASGGLVTYEVEGLGANIESHKSKYLDISYDEFQRMCVTRCQRNAECAAVTVSECPCDMEALGMNPQYTCSLIAADVEVRGVKAAQLSDSTMASDTVYVKKGHVFPSVEPCKVQGDNLEMLFYCATCLQALQNGVSNPMCVAPHFDAAACQGLLSEPSNADFMPKVAQAAGCVDMYGGDATACMTCATEKLAKEANIAGTICTESDKLNLFRGHCKAECNTTLAPGVCEGMLQTSALCVTGSPLIRNSAEGPVWMNGLINAPYACP